MKARTRTVEQTSNISGNRLITMPNTAVNRQTVSGRAGQPRRPPRGPLLRRPRTPSTGALSQHARIEAHRTRTRNYNRGVRSEKATEQRKEKRRIKRNLARHARRQEKNEKAPAALAQELRPPTPKLELNREIRIATLNVRGLKKLGKRIEIEYYMKDNRIDIMTIQETHLGEDTREVRKHYSWFFSGGVEQGTIHHGVGIIVNSKIRPYIKDIEPINERLMSITLSGKIDLHVIATYAPTAAAPTIQKEEYYEQLKKHVKPKLKQGVLVIGADMNAKLNEAGDGGEEGIGKHVFGLGHEVEEGEGVPESRQMLQEFLIDLQMSLANTLFDKPPQKLITYKLDKSAGNEPPYVKGKYDVIDYIIVPNRWKNTIKNVQSDIKSGLDSDHFPLIATTKVALKANYRYKSVKHQYVKCSTQQKLDFNKQLQDTRPQTKDSATIAKWIKEAADKEMTIKTKDRHPFDISEETKNKMTEKRRMIQEGCNDEQLKPIQKELSRSLRKDKRRYTASMVSSELDIRDIFMGIRNLKRNFQGIPLGLNNLDKKHVPLHARAETAADFLANTIWSHPASPPAPGGCAPPAAGERAGREKGKDKIHTQELGMATGKITMTELAWAINKLKRAKAAGPDGVPTDCYKEMDRHQLQIVLDMLNEWWETGHIPTEATQANVILLYKKGDKSNLENYRPISLLNTNYKLYTAILQKRISEAIDKHLQETQYGFRQKRGTAQAIHYIRRIMEKGEKTETKTLLVLLDWEKAFDKVKHAKLFEAMERMNVPDKMMQAIRGIYREPTFKVEMAPSDAKKGPT